MDISTDDDNGCLMSFGHGGRAACTVGEDRISLLPEAVLSHILSFLPTIEAIHSSILAHRWRYLWRYVRTLSFDVDRLNHLFTREVVDNSRFLSKKRRREMEEEMQIMVNCRIINFIELVSIYPRAANTLKFHLCCNQYYTEMIDIWNRIIYVSISNAVTRKVREVDLCLKFHDVALPPCLFTSESLEVLTLNLDKCHLKLSASMGFTRLKTLHLVSVLLCNENLTCRLFSSSPVLENLIIKDCRHDLNFRVVEVSSLSLRNLILEIGGGGGGVNAYNGLSDCAFKISAPRLEFFAYKGFVAQDYTLGELPAIMSTRIRCYSICSVIEQGAERLRKVLEGLCNVEVLKICGVCIETLLPPPDCFDRLPIPFYHLRHLELSMDLIGKNLQVIINFINTNPDLRTLVINLHVAEDGGFEYANIIEFYCCSESEESECTPEPSDDEEKEKYLGVLKLSSRKVLQNLRNVKINNIVGGLEIEFLKYLLETQMLLERVSISFAHYRRWHWKISEELLGFPRASPSLAVLMS